MKQTSIYNITKGADGTALKFNQEVLATKVFTELTDLQMLSIGLVDVHEGVLVDTNMQGYTVFKVKIAKRKEVKGDTLEREYQRRLRDKSSQGIAFDMEVLLREVEDDLTRTSEWSDKSFLAFIDNVGERVLVDASRTDAEEAISLLHDLVETPIAFEVVNIEPAIMQKLLTQYVVKPHTVPDPFIIGEHVELGKKTEVGKKAPASNVIVKKEDVTSAEVINHIGTGKYVNKLEFDFENMWFKVDNTGYINGMSFEEALKYKADPEVTEAVNFLSEYQVKLPVLSKMLDILFKEVDNTTI